MTWLESAGHAGLYRVVRQVLFLIDWPQVSVDSSRRRESMILGWHASSRFQMHLPDPDARKKTIHQRV